MRVAITVVSTLVLLANSLCQAQAQLPSVASVMEQYDGDQDGALTLEEVAGSRYARQFSRWDADQDGSVFAKDIIAYRQRFGIAADGTRTPVGRPRFTVPDVDELPRVDRTTRLPRSAAQNSAYILNTSRHEVAGSRYVILTDHTSKEFLEPLRRLADHRNGTVLTFEDLATLHRQSSALHDAREQLRKEKAKFVAIAPRIESLRENMLLGMWELLSTVDEDPQIDVLPGLLVASNAKAFARLIDQSIHFTPLATEEIKPVAISQVQRASETRSLQKAGILRSYFARFGCPTPVVAIYGPQAADAVKLPGEDVWNLNLPGKGEFIKEFPAPVSQSLETARLIVMHGHGIPGMSCSVDVEGIPDDLSGKILFDRLVLLGGAAAVGPSENATGSWWLRGRSARCLCVSRRGSGCRPRVRPPAAQFRLSSLVSCARIVDEGADGRRVVPATAERTD